MISVPMMSETVTETLRRILSPAMRLGRMLMTVPIGKYSIDEVSVAPAPRLALELEPRTGWFTTLRKETSRLSRVTMRG